MAWVPFFVARWSCPSYRRIASYHPQSRNTRYLAPMPIARTELAAVVTGLLFVSPTIVRKMQQPTRSKQLNSKPHIQTFHRESRRHRCSSSAEARCACSYCPKLTIPGHMLLRRPTSYRWEPDHSSEKFLCWTRYANNLTCAIAAGHAMSRCAVL